MDSILAPPLTEEELSEWQIDFSLLPGDEFMTSDDEGPPDMTGPGDRETVLPPGDRREGIRHPYTYVHGKRACACLAAVVPIVEKNLRDLGVIKHDLSGLITQGSYNGKRVHASAGTHSGGGVWDVKWSLVNSDAKKQTWMKAGIIPFDRQTIDAPVSKWPPHGHIVVAGCPHRARSAAEQEKAARLGLNGLANRGCFRGHCGRIITWTEAMHPSPPPPPPPPPPRDPTPKPWPHIGEDGDRGPQTMDRLRMQLKLKPTGSGDWSHWDVIALLIWLGEPCTDTAVITPIALLKLQHRVGAKPTGRWDEATTRHLQHYLNQNR